MKNTNEYFFRFSCNQKKPILNLYGKVSEEIFNTISQSCQNINKIIIKNNELNKIYNFPYDASIVFIDMTETGDKDTSYIISIINGQIRNS